MSGPSPKILTDRAARARIRDQLRAYMQASALSAERIAKIIREHGELGSTISSDSIRRFLDTSGRSSMLSSDRVELLDRYLKLVDATGEKDQPTIESESDNGTNRNTYMEHFQTCVVNTPLKAGGFLASLSISIGSRQNQFRPLSDLITSAGSDDIKFEPAMDWDDFFSHLLHDTPEYYLPANKKT